jgi:hypothetical protein
MAERPADATIGDDVSVRRAFGQKVEGHRATVSQISRSRDLWAVVCTCGWTIETAGRTDAIGLREGHLDEGVLKGAPLRGGGREAPSGPWKNPPQSRRDDPGASA